MNYLKRIVVKIKEWLFPPVYELTPKGEAFLKYLQDKEAGKDVYIQEYEDFLNKILDTEDAAAR